MAETGGHKYNLAFFVCGMRNSIQCRDGSVVDYCSARLRWIARRRSGSGACASWTVASGFRSVALPFLLLLSEWLSLVRHATAEEEEEEEERSEAVSSEEGAAARGACAVQADGFGASAGVGICGEGSGRKLGLLFHFPSPDAGEGEADGEAAAAPVLDPDPPVLKNGEAPPLAPSYMPANDPGWCGEADMDAGFELAMLGKSWGDNAAMPPMLPLRLDENEAASAGVGEDSLALRGTLTVLTLEFFPHRSDECAGAVALVPACERIVHAREAGGDDNPDMYGDACGDGDGDGRR